MNIYAHATFLFIYIAVTLLVIFVKHNDAYLIQKGGSVVVGYFPDWTVSSLPAEKVPFTKLTHVNYAFALVGQDNRIQLDSTSLLKQVVDLAHAKQTKVLISIGGWTGSRYFSSMAATAATRDVFVQDVISFIKSNNVDGIDLDWEFPGRLGMSCNVVDVANDSANLLLLLKELRTKIDAAFGNAKKEITMAVRIAPFDGPSGTPLTDVSAYARYIDRINIMAYDIAGPWSKTTNANAPLTGPESFVGSLQAWRNAGFPAEKIVMGLAFYGRALKVTQPMHGKLAGTPIESVAPKGDQEDAPWAEPCPGAKETLSGTWQWNNIRAQGLLSSDKANAVAGQGWQKFWDDQTQTPWLYNDSDKIFITYDDARSLTVKADKALCEGLSGVMIWDLHQDNGELINVVWNAVHKNGKKC